MDTGESASNMSETFERGARDENEINKPVGLPVPGADDRVPLTPLVEDEEYPLIKQENTLEVVFNHHQWIKREQVIELIENTVSTEDIIDVHENNKKWSVKLSQKHLIVKLMTQGIPYEFQGKKFTAYPNEVDSEITEVAIMHIPHEIPNNILCKVLSKYGDCMEVDYVKDNKNIATGTRCAKIKLRMHIPKKIKLPNTVTGGRMILTSYKTRPKIFGNACYICYTTEHTPENCPNRVTCHVCGGKGRPHLPKNCRYRNPASNTARGNTAHIQEKEEVAREFLQELAKKKQETDKTTEKSTKIDAQEKKHLQNDGNAVEGPIKEDRERPQIMVLGDSQVKRIQEVSDGRKINAVSVSGGKIENITRWLKSHKEKEKNLVLYVGTNNPKINNNNRDNITRATKQLLQEAKEKADYVYIMALVPYKGSNNGPQSKSKLNRIFEREAKNHEVHYIPTHESFTTDDDTTHLFESDRVHVSQIGARILIQSFMNEVEGWQETKTRKRRKKSPDVNSDPTKMPKKGDRTETEDSMEESATEGENCG